MCYNNTMFHDTTLTLAAILCARIGCTTAPFSCDIPQLPKSEIDGIICDLAKKTLPELLELRERQLKLLRNKSFISKLPDKGAKVHTFHDKIVNEIKTKRDEEQTCLMLNKLSLNTISKETVQNIEWVGKVEKNAKSYLDSDDDSEPEDVLQILSQSTALEKKVEVLAPDKPLITAKDLVDIGNIPHVQYIVGITEKTSTDLKPTRQFKPYKTTKSDVHNPEKEVLRKKHKHWEVTAATPPPSVYGTAKVLSIEESLKLEQEHNIHMKEVVAKHAAEKLLARTGIKMADLPNDTSIFGKYREIDSDNESLHSDAEASDKEVYDEEPERGGVIFTVTN